MGTNEGDLYAGTDGTLALKWKKPADSEPYRYIYAYDPSIEEKDIISIAESVR
ncbi:hypothetical protein [Paenibacillus alkalitolerans]|uniref:hypothetical protein n=1 Tax=Paenibacillus alkalitolerans TaxID=2799335 RepID=UPI0018F4E136|nr:hypothetical protein [Paenibacillus alkalitolerans]